MVWPRLLHVVKVPLCTMVSFVSAIILFPLSLGLFSLFPNSLSSKSIKTSEPKNLLLFRSTFDNKHLYSFNALTFSSSRGLFWSLSG